MVFRFDCHFQFQLIVLLLIHHVGSTSSPINIADGFYSQILSRSDPTFQWGMLDDDGTYYRDDGYGDRPKEWVSSLFGGNGDLGYMLFSPEKNSLRMDVSKLTLWDDRTPDLPEYKNDFVMDQPRMPSGYFEISWWGNSSSDLPRRAKGRMNLFDGTTTLHVETTTSGDGFDLFIFANAAAPSSPNVIVMEATAFGGGSPPTITFIPANPNENDHDNYIPNPPPYTTRDNVDEKTTVEVTVQPHLPSKGTAHAAGVMRIDDADDASRSTYFVSLSPVLPDDDAATNFVVAELNRVTEMPYAPVSTMLNSHKNYWNNWWPQGGFLSIDHSPMESFFYVQQYKFNCASMTGELHDLMGPWHIEYTPWPDLHWDLNLQYTYYMPLVTNRLSDLSISLTNYMETLLRSGNLKTNVPEAWQLDSAAAPTGASSLSGNTTCNWSTGPNCTTSPPSQTGNLLWTLQLLDLHHSYTGNSTIATDVLCPLLDEALMFYHHFHVDNSSDHTIHLQETASPEYPGPPGSDCNYDISLYRWGLQKMIELGSTYSKCNNAHISVFEDTLARITWFPVANGTLAIYADVPYGTPHRHFSHLMSLWPLRLLDTATNQSNYNLARDSVNLWLSTPEEDSMFYRPAAAVMNLLLEQKDASFDNITYLLDRRVEGSTWYREGSQGSCTETPYAAAYAIVDWMMQSWNKTTTTLERIIDVFKGIDDEIVMNAGDYVSARSRIAGAQFHSMSAQGGFLVSGKREILSLDSDKIVSRTNWIGIEARKELSVLIRTNMERPLDLEGGGDGVVLEDVLEGEGLTGENFVRISGLEVGEVVVIFR